jgi:hypothetical protein
MEYKEKQRRLSHAIIALLRIEKAFILCQRGRVKFCCAQSENWLYLVGKASINLGTKEKKRRDIDASP